MTGRIVGHQGKSGLFNRGFGKIVPIWGNMEIGLLPLCKYQFQWENFGEMMMTRKTRCIILCCCSRTWEVCRSALLFETCQRLQCPCLPQEPPAPQDLLDGSLYGRAACSTADICCCSSGWLPKLAVFGVIWPMAWVPKHAHCLKNLKKSYYPLCLFLSGMRCTVWSIALYFGWYVSEYPSPQSHSVWYFTNGTGPWIIAGSFTFWCTCFFSEHLEYLPLSIVFPTPQLD